MFEVTKTIADTGEWESLSADFSVSSSIPYLSGSNKGSVFESDNSRVKLFVSSDGDFSLDDIHIAEKLEGSDAGRYAGRSVLVLAEIIGLENVDDAEAVCSIGGRNVFEEPVSIKKGFNSFTFKGKIPTNADGLMTLDITTGGESVFDRENIVTMFYKGGANVYPSIDALKAFGAGQYLVEFDVADGADGDTAVVSVGGVTETADVFSNGTGIAEIRLTDGDIQQLSGTDEITVSCGKTVSSITVKKVGSLKTVN